MKKADINERLEELVNDFVEAVEHRKVGFSFLNFPIMLQYVLKHVNVFQELPALITFKENPLVTFNVKIQCLRPLACY
jgi:hypothetical protein